MIRIGLYLGIGALCHVAFVGSQFDWSSAWTWVWLLGWPLMALLAAGAAAVTIFLFAILLVAVAGIGTPISKV